MTETEAVRAFLQGILAGTCLQPGIRTSMKIASVDVETDLTGEYRDHFIVTTDSGIRLKVRITVEGSP